MTGHISWVVARTAVRRLDADVGREMMETVHMIPSRGAKYLPNGVRAPRTAPCAALGRWTACICD